MPQRVNYNAASPAGMKALGAVYGYVRQSGLPSRLVDLVFLRVSQINGCAYCIDMHSRDLIKAGLPVEHLVLVAAWPEAGSIFSAQEKAALLIGCVVLPSSGLAQTPRPSSVLPSGGGQPLLDPSDAVLLLLDHQAEVNARHNQELVDTVRKTGGKDVDHCRRLDRVCVMFPVLDAEAAGYKVYSVMDASGDPSELASRTTLARFAQAGVVPRPQRTPSEVHRTWNRPDAAELAKLYGLVAPNYAAVAESYPRAQEVAGQKK